jgi:crotonobetainyl-CoA:carnitine CoA-transferase CaiB-like acyl-CoA transferase
MGACVIKVEKPGGDPSREIGPFWQGVPHPERSLSFWYTNTGKRGVTLDIEHESGREILKRLIARTDVMVETFSPGHLESLGLDYGALGKINARLILVSVTGFGQSGPRSAWSACDLTAAAFGGQMHVTGSPVLQPLKAFGGQSYYSASLFAAFAILLALRKRRKNGSGEHLDISLQEAVASTLDHVLVRYFYENDIAARQEGLHWNHSFFISPCRDGFIHLTLFQKWETLVEWLDSEGMAADLTEDKWRDEDYRRRHVTHIIDVIRRWTKMHTAAELFQQGQLMGFPWAPVCSPAEVVESPQLTARGFFVEIEHPEIGNAVKYPGMPYRSEAMSPLPQKRAPMIGEDNIHIYQGELGLSEDELERLSAIGVI